jgi:hypothetical protein
MAGEVGSPAVTVGPTDLLYRGINPQYYQQGQVLTGVFFLKKKHTLKEGPSVGITRLIPLMNFHALMREEWGVASFPASVPQELKLTVKSLPEPRWDTYAHAHAVITDYQSLTDKARNDAARILRDALQKNILIKPKERPAPE